MPQDTKLKCPNCRALMESAIEPDIKFEKCPKCQGIFLDKDKLNALATGMVGDIEFCSLDSHLGDPDKFPARPCPKCQDQTMKKVDLLIYSDIIFDHCEKCHGWFLDQGELKKMNDRLNKLRESQGGSKELRETVKDHLVTLKRSESVDTRYLLGLPSTSYTTTEWSRIDAYYKKPLEAGLRLSTERWLMKFWKLFGAQDIKTGNSEFDSTFQVQATTDKNIPTILSPETQKVILDFYRSALFKAGKKSAFEVLDDRVVYTYLGKIPDEQRKEIINALVEITISLEN